MLYFYAHELPDIIKTNQRLADKRHILWSVVRDIPRKKEEMSILFKTLNRDIEYVFLTYLSTTPRPSDEIILEALEPIFDKMRLLRQECEKLVDLLREIAKRMKILRDSI